MIDENNRIYVKHAKNLFSPEALSDLRDKYTAIAGNYSNAAVSDREKDAIARGESADALRMKEIWYDAWKNPVSRFSLLDEVSPFTHVIFPVQVRHVRRTHQHHVPWHQDIAYIRLLGKRAHTQVLTCFIPLEPEPAKCTTLQFAFDNTHGNQDVLYKHMPLDGFGAGIEGVDFKELAHYNLDLGDALIFGDHALHRTYLPENCKVERRSLEFRLVMPEHTIPDKDYFDLKTLSFVRYNEDMQAISSSV